MRCTLPNTDIRVGMVILTDHGGVDVTDDAEPSSAMPGCTRIEVEIGTLYLDSDGSSLVEFDPDDYKNLNLPGTLLKEV